MDQTPFQATNSDGVSNAYAPPSADQPPKATRKSWVTRVLIGLGAGVLFLVLVGIVGAVLSYRGLAEIKPAMVNLANEFAACSLAHDRACVLRLSNWDSSTFDKGEKFVDAVNRKLGKRGAASLDEKSVSFRRNASVGNGLRSRVTFRLRVAYEHDPAAHEVFLLEDRGHGLKVVSMNWNSEALVLR